ncbi:hypothetical protein FACS189487_07140 [Campylobacterota bacterium]|nr:hypothetical protein FACS189487_07140 [Campylobacterota bacterium]
MADGAKPKSYSTTIDVKTSDVAKSLSDLIAREKVLPASVDFDILKVNTYIKEPKKDEYAALEKRHFEKMHDLGYMLDPKLQFLQEYELRFKPIAAQPFKLLLALSADKFHTTAHITIKAGSIIKAGVDQKALYNYFNKIKLKNNMMIFLMDEALRAAVNKLSNLANGEPFKQDITFALCAWITPLETINDSMEICYQKKAPQEDETKRVNYAERGFVSSVKSGELLLEYIMARRGTAGRSFNGKLISMPDPTITHQPTFSIDESTIEVKESESKKMYYAKVDGYVRLSSEKLEIDRTITVDSIDLKTTGNIRAGLENNVKIRVEGKDPSDEVIGADMVVEATDVYANGSIASGVLITAKSIVVKGLTHQKSDLVANSIEVNVLRGLAQGDEVKVKTLEGGVVKTTKADIEQAVGGEIYGKDICVGNLRGKVYIKATHSIVIRQVSKGENKLIIDPSVDGKEQSEFGHARMQIENFKARIEELKKESENIESYLSKNQNAFKQIQQKVIKDRAEKRATGETFIKIAQEYLANQKRYENIDLEIKVIESQIADKRLELAQIDKQVLESFVINETGVWNGHNEVIFKLPFLEEEFIKTLDDMRIRKIELVEGRDKENGEEYEFKLTYA